MAETTPLITDVTAVVLAGGRSSRMGMDKALIQFEGETLLARTVRLMRRIFAPVLVAGGDPERYPDLAATFAPDRLSQRGAVVGLHAALAAAGTTRVFAIACDAPFPNFDLIRHLLTVDPDADWVVPRTAKGLEPLFAVYAQPCRVAIEDILATGRRRISLLAERVATRFVEEEDVRRFDPELRSFININTPGEQAIWLAPDVGRGGS